MRIPCARGPLSLTCSTKSSRRLINEGDFVEIKKMPNLNRICSNVRKIK